MRWVQPEVFLIGKTVIQNQAVERWLNHIGVDVVERNTYAFGTGKTDAERLVELTGRRCYMSFQPELNPNVKKIRENIREYIENIMKSGHGSVLEHVYFTFAIEGVSRVLTGEMNRHRAGVAVSEGSMRYIRYNDIPIVDVPSLNVGQSWIDETESVMQKKRWTRNHIRQLCLEIEQAYRAMVSTWADVLEGTEFTGKKHITSMLRRIIPMGVATGGVWTFNVRALRHMLTMRGSGAAEEEICLVARKILEIMMKEEPILFGDFKVREDGFYAPDYKKV